MTEDRPPQAPGPAAGPAAAPPPPPPPAPPAGPGGPGGPDSTSGPAGPGPTEPPPLTAFAWRNGLVRPTQGRLLAGVSGAFARATNTDPVLWRVVIAVLTIFAGIGALVYVVAWLILPADGDTASPIEALAGRGRSATSTTLTIIGSIIVVFALAAYISEPFRATPLVAAALLGGVLLLLLRDQRGRPRTANPVWPQQAAPGAFPSGPPLAPTAPGAMAYGPPPAPAYPAAGPQLTPPPFAPHGPFVPPPPPPPAPPVMRPPRPKPPRSRLGLLTFSVALLAIGAMAAVNLAGAVHIPPLVFIAVALGIVGLGLLVGTWFGRARALIALGILLSLFLGAGTASDWNQTGHGWWRHTGTVTWAPASVDTIQPSYRQGVGDATLDLSSVDFSTTTRPVTIDVQVDLGTLRVILPSNVDVTVDARVDVGQANVLRESWDGLGQNSRTVTDLGPDGAGGGQLRLNTSVDVGDLEVTR